VRMDCLTSGNLTTSTTPALMASIMYTLLPTSSSSCQGLTLVPISAQLELFCPLYNPT
jgi:hypothetical protein